MTKKIKKRRKNQYINDINSIFDLNISIDVIQILFNDAQINIKNNEKKNQPKIFWIKMKILKNVKNINL